MGEGIRYGAHNMAALAFADDLVMVKLNLDILSHVGFLD